MSAKIRLFASSVGIVLLIGSSKRAHGQRLLGLDISSWQGNISQTTWNNLRTIENRQFVFLRSSRGGTTGFYDQNDSANANGANTLSQRYDDQYFVQNINRATAAGMFAGTYHFSRPDIVESTLNSGGIRNSGVDEADHFIQMAGPWMRPGYLVPVHDLEAGDGIRTDNEMAQFCIDFSNRIFERMGIRPGIYINGNYSANILQTASVSLRDQIARPAVNRPSVIAPCYPVLWDARWPNQTDPNSIDVQGTNPKDTYAGFYGPWDDYGDANPWAFWQYASAGRLQSFNGGANNLDFNVVHGDVEYLKDFLVPAVWMNDSSGDWSALANWNSGQTPVAPVQGPGQIARVGTLIMPTPRLPGAAGTGVTSGQNDTVILERPNANIAVTLSAGTHNIRKLFMRETLNITGGSLTINYDPKYISNPAFPGALRSGNISAQFSGPVTLAGGALSVNALQVDSGRTFTVSGGTLAFNTISLISAGTPAKLAINGNVAITTLGGAARIFGGAIDLGGGNRSLAIEDGPVEVDLSIDTSIANGALTKSGPGTIRLSGPNTYAGGTTIAAGVLMVNGPNSGTGPGPVTVEGGSLRGSGVIAGAVEVKSGGTIAVGTESSLGALTLNSAPILAGTVVARISRNGGAPETDKLTLASGVLTYGGALVVSNIGAAVFNGDVFPLFSAPAYAGSFDSYVLPPLGSGLRWNLEMLAVNGTIAVTNTAPGRFDATPIFNGTSATLHFAGAPGWTYYLERSTNLSDWFTISTNVAPANGLFEYVDPDPPLPNAFYRFSSKSQ